MTVLIPIALLGAIVTAIGYYFATHEGKLQQSKRETARRTRDARMELKAGTLVHLDGIPVWLSVDVLVEAHPGNWEIIECEHARFTNRERKAAGEREDA